VEGISDWGTTSPAGVKPFPSDGAPIPYIKKEVLKEKRQKGV
jgi:hypothetical protein